MKETEILGLVTMVYDYEPNFAKNGIESSNPLVLIVHEVFNFLKRKKYFGKDDRPTKKLYKLLDAYDVRIAQIEECRKADETEQEIVEENESEEIEK